MNANSGSYPQENVQGPEGSGKFIVIEGTDSSGKHTQAKLLFDYLLDLQREVELLSFPQYDTVFGALVGKYLRGEYGTLETLPPEIPSLLYALDRFQVKDKLQRELKGGKWFIADRYTQSNLAHQGAKLSGTERESFIAWIDSLESPLPQPDLVIYLHVPVAITQHLMQGRNHKSYLDADKNRDIHELDTEYQQRVVDIYLNLANTRENWAVINCVDEEKDAIRSIDEIHNEIIEVVKSRL